MHVHVRVCTREHACVHACMCVCVCVGELKEGGVVVYLLVFLWLLNEHGVGAFGEFGTI